jgi:DNA end-binding protein Ku
MAARALWKAKLKLGSTQIPVQLYAALTDRTVRFHILEEETKTRVKQHMVDPTTGKEVAKDEIQKGFEVEPGTFVLLSEEELEELKPESSREIEVVHFIDPTHIDSQWYERPYYVGPDGDQKTYFALAEALAKQQKEGVAKWVMRDKEYVGALRSQDGYLMLITLKHAEEVVSAEELPSPGGRALEKKELGMAKQLVEMLEGEFDPSEFRDEYRDRVTEFIESKAKGKTPKLRPIRAKRAPASLEKVLSKSIATLKKEKAAA